MSKIVLAALTMSSPCPAQRVEEEEPFQVVGRKGRIRPRTIKSTPLQHEDRSIDVATALRRIQAAKEDFKESDYYKSFFITLKESISALDSKVVEIFCFGLGHIGECMISRYQLALVLCLRDYFDVECLVHDPLFFSDECEILKTLGFTLIPVNEEGKRKVRSDGLSIAYLPHCPRQLTNNLLWKNWGVLLKNCILISNSFTTIVESKTQRFVNKNFKYIFDIYAFAREFSLVNCFKYNNIFNDTSIHIFPENTLNLITENFWDLPEGEPKYDDETEYIAANIIDRLKINE